jgi:hypothetical protein
MEKMENLRIVALIRFFMEMYMTFNMKYPDEYYQGTEIAYHIVYGGVDVPWEWKP